MSDLMSIPKKMSELLALPEDEIPLMDDDQWAALEWDLPSAPPVVEVGKWEGVKFVSSDEDVGDVDMQREILLAHHNALFGSWSRWGF